MNFLRLTAAVGLVFALTACSDSGNNNNSEECFYIDGDGDSYPCNANAPAVCEETSGIYCDALVNCDPTVVLQECITLHMAGARCDEVVGVSDTAKDCQLELEQAACSGTNLVLPYSCQDVFYLRAAGTEPDGSGAEEDAAEDSTVTGEVWGRWFFIDKVAVGVMNADSLGTAWDSDSLPDCKVVVAGGFPSGPSEIVTSPVFSNVEVVDWTPAGSMFKVSPSEVLRIAVYEVDEGAADTLIAVYDIEDTQLEDLMRTGRFEEPNPDPNLFSIRVDASPAE